jgi:hypothetical protein
VQAEKIDAHYADGILSLKILSSTDKCNRDKTLLGRSEAEA